MASPAGRDQVGRNPMILIIEMADVVSPYFDGLNIETADDV